MTVGANVSPGWANTVDGRNLPQMWRVIADLRPELLRMPWVQNQATLDTLQEAHARGIGTIVTDDHALPVDQVASEILAAPDSPSVVEGVNEPDVPATGYTVQQQPITAEKLAEVTERQTRLYELLAGRIPVLTPPAVYPINEPALAALPSDLVAIHRYHPSDGTPPTASTAALPSVSKPIWVTETGISSYKKGPLCVLFGGRYVVTPEQQAAYLVSMDSLLRANGAERVVIYSMQNTGTNQCKPGNNFGLYTWDGVAKPAGMALRG